MSKSAKRGKHLLNVTLSGIEELEQFPTVESRRAAIDSFGKVGARDLAVGVVVLMTVTVCSAMFAKYATLLFFVRAPRWTADIAMGATGAAVFFLMMRSLHRRGAAPALRERLLESGVPVCTACGYALRGLDARATACPECGASIDPRALALLATSGPAAGAARSELGASEP